YAGRLANLFYAWRRHDLTVRELSRLGDRELADIGLGRADIARVPRETAQAE
ncbi:MAG TPA: DUF1127 domain-containing protein, partial [Xanthobacteraceae bacterium]|nr:DUF1127 domain-containing protein [Xanthobacteraceae bacterium]